MTQTSSTQMVPEHRISSPPRKATNHRPAGYRIVHVAVPEPVFNHAKAQAYLSGLRFPEYVASVLRDGKPYLEHRSPTVTVAASTTDNVRP